MYMSYVLEAWGAEPIPSCAVMELVRKRKVTASI